jgi:PAS domain S-box-containing protein
MRLQAQAEHAVAAERSNVRFELPESLLTTLTDGSFSEAVPVGDRARRRLRQAETEVVMTASMLNGRVLSGETGRTHWPLVRQLGRYCAGLDRVTSETTQEVQRGLALATKRLSRWWYALYVLAAVAVGVVGALTFLLWRWRRVIAETGVRERYYRTLVQSSQDLIYALDANGRWTFVNEAARRIYGLEPREMLGRVFTELTAPDYVKQDRQAFRKILRGESVADHETIHLRGDGSRVHIVFTATPLQNAKGETLGTIGTGTDVTHMRRMQEQLLLNERLQAVATLGGGIAHDFNNLLTVIIGQAEVARAKGDVPPQIERRINSIYETAMRARKLTQQLIAFARRQPLQKDVIDLVAVVRQMGELTRQLAGERIRVQEILPARAVRIVGDWSQIEQVIINLVVNARDAMPDKGTVTISVQRRELTAAEASPHGLEPGEWAVLEVSDDGVGIDPAHLGRIFDPFFTTKEPGKGTGLGLATVHGVVHQHDGAIVAHTTPGSGTCMRVILPLATAGKAATQPESEPELEPETSTSGF